MYKDEDEMRFDLDEFIDRSWEADEEIEDFDEDDYEWDEDDGDE